ncbi:hypothetical protein CMT62_13325 [Elizabethkingia anophelis]|nr:hypothetical protein [Elizabethkingia anophelis]MDV3655193.1 hypothetical protein [Elizabethkingia anophelis]MDV3894643.1 hypothetical protein [Elizabethkingia anophelis]MDV3917969.1 hypothetical protein [Elizabethkingia anophelis]MDV3936080.1 hypothetical protein [Elizabethkingia anophelis]
MEVVYIFWILITYTLSIIILFYIIKGAILSALENKLKKHNSELNKTLNNILIQLGGNPIEFDLIDKEIQEKIKKDNKEQFLGKSRWATSSINSESELNKSKSDYEQEAIRRKQNIKKI